MTGTRVGRGQAGDAAGNHTGRHPTREAGMGGRHKQQGAQRQAGIP